MFHQLIQPAESYQPKAIVLLYHMQNCVEPFNVGTCFNACAEKPVVIFLFLKKLSFTTVRERCHLALATEMTCKKLSLEVSGENNQC